MNNEEQKEQKVFENEVRRIARNLWPGAEFDGSVMLGARETDGFFETEECIHLLEATVSRQEKKAKEDIGKLAKNTGDLERKSLSKPIQCWFITKEEPTADQRNVGKEFKSKIKSLNVLSFSQFQSKLIAVNHYLECRDKYPFGSIRDPGTDSIEVKIDYIPLDLLEKNSSKLWNILELVKNLEIGGRVLISGDYGAGKSMTLKEIYKELRKKYFRERTVKFPVYLNLRDHQGQKNPAEVLDRHARNIGFPNPSHLVRAWRAGYVILILDGFDEVASLGMQGHWKKLKDTRYRSMEAVRDFVKNSPQDCGLIIAGRSHFFDNEAEKNVALSASENWLQIPLSDFNEEQIKVYLDKSKFTGNVPQWMPTRPLLVGYLISRKLLSDEKGDTKSGASPFDLANGWDDLINRICKRESEIEAGIDQITLRKILERLATKARASADGLGPITSDQIIGAFKEVCGYAPDEQQTILLQRLPGLGVYSEAEGTRRFIDEDLVDAYRAGDIVSYIENPYGFEIGTFNEVEFPLQNVAVQIVAFKVAEAKYEAKKIVSVLKKIRDQQENNLLLSDVLRIGVELGMDVSEPIRISKVIIPDLDLDGEIGDLSNVEFSDCFFNKLTVDPEVDVTKLPRFKSCYISEIEGRISKKDLPANIFDENCEIDGFSNEGASTNAILDLDLPLGVKVMLTILKKIYIQKGSGRKQNALFRGLDHHGKRLVPEILKMLSSEGIIFSEPKKRDKAVWLPNRVQNARVRRIVAAPSAGEDPLLKKAENIS